MEAAIGSVMRSVMSVTFSSGWIRRQVKTAERAPGVNDAGKGCDSRCDAVAMGLLRCGVTVHGILSRKSQDAGPCIYSG